jgi:hypothetical protein
MIRDSFHGDVFQFLSFDHPAEETFDADSSRRKIGWQSVSDNIFDLKSREEDKCCFASFNDERCQSQNGHGSG